MRSSRSESEPFEMQRFRVRGAAVTGAAAAACAAVLLGAGSASVAAWPDGAWTGSGTAATTVTSDGTASDPVFDYATRGQRQLGLSGERQDRPRPADRVPLQGLPRLVSGHGRSAAVRDPQR